MPSSPSPRPGRRRRVADTSALARLLVALVVGVLAAVAAWRVFEPAISLALGWVALAATDMVWTWVTIWPMDARETATHATREEPRRAVTHLIVLVAAVASLGVVGLVLATGDESRRVMTAAIAVLSVATSWATIHTLFGLRYARLYYTGPDGGIDFHQDAPPRYSDFLYIGATVGMSFAISDTDLQSSEMRRAALAQALLAYLFGSVILAGLVNLVAGM